MYEDGARRLKLYAVGAETGFISERGEGGGRDMGTMYVKNEKRLAGKERWREGYYEDWGEAGLGIVGEGRRKGEG